MDRARTEKQFKFTDDIMFYLVMQNEEICRGVIETIIGSEIGKIKSLRYQDFRVVSSNTKPIRLDICVENERGEIVNIEMQVAKQGNIPKRMRFYHSVLDVSMLKTGEQYRALKKTYIIFICSFDLFKRNEPLYFFENMCQNSEALKLGDETIKIVVNALAFNKAKTSELRTFLKYLTNDIAEDVLTNKIDDAVRIEQLRQAAMEYLELFSPREMDIREEGKAEGAYQTKCETAKKLLEMGIPIEKVLQGTGLTEDEILAL